MKLVTRNSVIAVVAASGAMAMAASAHADSTAEGSAAGSPGVISGNTLQLPLNLPVNVCGNTLNVVGLLNPAAGNSCANRGGGRNQAEKTDGAVAKGGTKNSPGVVSGNGIQVPVDLPVNVSGNSVNVVGIANPVFGNTSVNDAPEQPTPLQTQPPVTAPPVKHVPPAEPTPVSYPRPSHTTPRPVGMSSLAHTGTDDLLPAAATSAALLLGGAVLYRKFRTTAAR
jgi:hypothetical protein